MTLSFRNENVYPVSPAGNVRKSVLTLWKTNLNCVIFASVVLLCAVILCSCAPGDRDTAVDQRVDAPVLVNLSGHDEDLTSYINQRYELAMQFPNSASERGRLGMAYDINGWTEEAIDTYDQAHRLDPFELMWPYFSALLEASRDRLEVANSKIDTALEIDPKYVPGWLWKGNWLIRLQRFEQATEAFEQAHSIDRNNYAIVGRAHAALDGGDAPSAIDLLEPLLAETPHPKLYRLLTLAYTDIGNEAKAEVTKALSHNDSILVWPDSLLSRRESHVRGFEGRLRSAQGLLQSMRVEEGLQALQRLHEDFPGRQVVASNIAWGYSLRGNFDLAIETLQIGIEEHPEHQPYYTQLGDLLGITGNLPVALALLEKSIVLLESDSEAHQKMGMVLMKLERLEEAIVAFERALELGSAGVAEICFQLGTIEGYRKNWNKATEHFKRVIELEPLSVAAHERLFLVYIEAGQFDELESAMIWAEQLGIPEDEFDPVRQYRDEVLAESNK